MSMAQAEEILLVDDSSDDAAFIVRAFKKHGVTNPVHVVSSGDEALAYLKCVDGTLPKVVLLDGRMPGMDGYAVLDAIRANPAWNGLPVVMLTGSDTVQELDRAYEHGATAFIGKPSSQRDMEYVITEFRRRWLR